MLIRSALRLFVALATLGAAHAQDASGCDKFKWSIARERGWFAADPKPIGSGGAAAPETGYVVTLVPDESAGFAMPPERAPKPGAFGAVVKLSVAKAGPYQITLSDEAWLDVVQGGAMVKSSAFSGQKNCPGVRKSVRFDLAAGEATLQISNSDAAKIMAAAAPAQ